MNLHFHFVCYVQSSLVATVIPPWHMQASQLIRKLKRLLSTAVELGWTSLSGSLSIHAVVSKTPSVTSTPSGPRSGQEYRDGIQGKGHRQAACISPSFIPVIGDLHPNASHCQRPNSQRVTIHCHVAIKGLPAPRHQYVSRASVTKKETHHGFSA